MMRASANNDFGDLKGLTVITYGVAAGLAFILLIGTIALAGTAAVNHFEAGSEDLVIPATLA
jgi:hypothetical protein